MIYVKNGALIYLVDDSEVTKYTQRGFEVYTPSVTSNTAPKLTPEQAALYARVEALKLDLPDGLTDEQVKEAVEKAEQENAGKAPEAGGKNGKDK